MTIWFQYSGHKREPNRTPIDYLSQRIVFDNFLSAIMAEVPCGLCNKHCDEDTECAHCSGCDKWHHMKCVSMTSFHLAVWSDANLYFLCRNCCFSENQYDLKKSLAK